MTDYQFYKRMGICPSCRKEKLFGTEAQCPECRAYRAERMQKKRENNRKEMNEYQRLLEKRLRIERKENGKCTKCGKDNKNSLYRTCAICRMKERNQRFRRNINKI